MERPDRFDEDSYLRACGAEFRRVRLERGLSREALAELSGVHLNTIGAVERGDHDINGSTKCRLLAALGCKSLRMTEHCDEIVLHDDPGCFPRADIQAMPESLVVRIIGQTMRQRRENAGLTLEQVAAAAGLHLNTLWNIERGLVSPMGIHIHRVYRALGVSVVTPNPELLSID
ncbi:MAG TPA: helix-turn-helix transcriptional regulator [Spirochaetales bacterium]|nr:helix-turn-helix transcriptional regulator [Spirochaetales bacterium]